MMRLALAISTAVALVYFIYRRRRVVTPAAPLAQSLSRDEKERVPGTWIPETFVYPPFGPDADFDVATRKPTPYRPFRYGPSYNITMGIRSMQWDNWIEVVLLLSQDHGDGSCETQIDQQFPRYHAVRSDRQATAKTDAVITLPGAEPHAREACLELAEFLSRKYPQMYTVERRERNSAGWYGEGEIRRIFLDKSATLDGMPRTYDLDKEDPMHVAGVLTQDEIILMVEGEDGQVSLSALWICGLQPCL